MPQKAPRSPAPDHVPPAPVRLMPLLLSPPSNPARSDCEESAIFLRAEDSAQEPAAPLCNPRPPGAVQASYGGRFVFPTKGHGPSFLVLSFGILNSVAVFLTTPHHPSTRKILGPLLRRSCIPRLHAVKWGTPARFPPIVRDITKIF